ncbi:hypothetical protein PTTG_01680 [Puccinia triticina 1-1 BBBD Race 1]|uniref:L-arabinokinase n=2 Tax=Puccinia triticina TaxID=208348 RepID=A0A0C4ELP3_PUCT1|nr:uncharacterized protein PtA15_16A385 [Puccinia triticina]OAV91336.1 hypothetical protein PTTG_01680 [Puccinia triticina 1-1 BBBD Race 1]WAQ92477.1 hypothetical protein PtA15_16A385 [Puccinia triticina]WAR64222.1 hypothetical protein PtB15_16B382 [Puccinia triticina]
MTTDGPIYHFAFYCSGHGFGHATRVTAITAGLLSRRHRVSIVSSAPESVFEAVLNEPSVQASYRFAIFEPSVIQPKAYDVDRLATFNNLHSFLTHKRRSVLEQERKWILDQRVDCVLIDAPFLPCAAASKANIPSVIISNFTFDSCYSYLSAFNKDEGGEQGVETEQLNELVAITVNDYAQADLLLRLPGAIPIPGFDEDIELPATNWVDGRAGSFTAEIDCKLARAEESMPRKKRVIDMPLIVRQLTKSAHDPQTKLALLAGLGVPADLLKADIKILLVSFGGQVIPSPRPPTSTDPGSDDHPEPTSQNQPRNALLPPGWIAIVCGLPSKSRPNDMPDRFFSITDSKFNYVPDLTAIADVVLGKLGYGTCSEVIATRTPFISVPRKMFVEEYGLKRLMKETSTINVEMSIKEFEDGRWASYIDLADRLRQQQNQIGLSSSSHHQPHSSNKNQNVHAVDIVVDHLEVFMFEKKTIKPSS